MKIFAINNAQCNQCKQCYIACPVKAIKVINNDISINYDECIACGLCFKACKQAAVTINVDTQKINEYIETARQVKEQNKRIENLEAENKSLRQDIEKSDNRLHVLINKLSVAVVAVNRNNRILFANEAFVQLLDYELRQKAAGITGLENIPFENMLKEDIHETFQNALHNDEGITAMDVEINHTLYGLSIYPLKKEGAVIALLRNLSDIQIARDEIEARINNVIDQNMAMVQNIGFLMGEETAKTTKILNSITQSITSGLKR